MYPSQFFYSIFKMSSRARKWYLKKLYPRITPFSANVQMEDGTRLLLHPKYDYVQREIFLYNGKYTYESHIVQWLKNNLKPGMTMVDVGAHVGYYIGIVSQSISKSGHGIFIEPLPELFNQLSTNIENNHYDWLHSINTAVSDSAGKLVLYPAKDSGRNSIAQNDITNGQPIMVQAITLDDLINEIDQGKIDIMQIDVEGAEVNVLKGARKCLEEHRIETILCEWHPEQIKRDFLTEPAHLIITLMQQGYKVTKIDREGHEVGFDLSKIYQYQHLIFRAKN